MYNPFFTKERQNLLLQTTNEVYLLRKQVKQDKIYNLILFAIILITINLLIRQL